jgi:hypothetical protein
MKKILFLLFIVTSINAQKTLTGRLVDSLSFVPIEFATLSIKHKAVGTISDENGHFSLAYDAQKDTIVISCIGYKSMVLYGSIPNNKELKLVKAVIHLPQLIIAPIEKECKKYKLKFNPALINCMLFEGTIIKRKLILNSSYLCGFGVELLADYDAKIIIRPHLTNSNLEPLLTHDYLLEKLLKKGKLTPIQFDFTETLPLDRGATYFLGIEILNIPGNASYSNHIQIICSDDLDQSSEVISIYNYTQEDGTIYNFGRQLNENIKLKLITSK